MKTTTTTEVQKKLTPAERIQKKFQSLQCKLQEHQDKGNKKGINITKRRIGKLAYEHPDLAPNWALGIPHQTTSVFQYGVLAVASGIYSADKQQVGTIDQQVRMRAVFYNFLIIKARLVLAKFRAAVDGPLQQAYRKVQKQIDDEYAVIRETNKASRKRVKSDAIQAHLDNIKVLKKERDPLFAPAQKELSHNIKTLKDQLKLITDEFNVTALKEAREKFSNQGPLGAQGLWFGQYGSLTIQAQAAFQKVLTNVGFRLQQRYERRDGTVPDLLTWEQFNGNGLMTTQFSNAAKRHQTVASVLDDSNPLLSNPLLSITPLTKDVWIGLFKGNPKYFDRPHDALKMVRMKVSTVNHKPVWIYMAVIMHRDLPLDGEVCESKLNIRRISRRRLHQTTLDITVARQASHRFSTEERTLHDVVVTPSVEDCGDFNLRVARWTKSDGTHGEIFLDPVHTGTKRSFIKDMQTVELFESVFKRNADKAFEVCDQTPVDEYPVELRSLVAAQSGKHSRYFLKNLLVRWMDIAPLVDPQSDRTDHRRLLFSKSRDLVKAHEFDVALPVLARMAQALLHLTNIQARMFCAALIFVERWDHLWPTEARLKALRRRKHDYCTAAFQVLKDAKSVTVVAGDLRTRAMTDNQKHAALSELIGAFKSYASQNGVVFIARRPLEETNPAGQPTTHAVKDATSASEQVTQSVH